MVDAKWRETLVHMISHHRALVLRFTLLAAIVGFFVGVFEAILLSLSRTVPTLLAPDVRYVIFFLAPLTDALTFGLLGLALGLVSAAMPRLTAWRLATVTAVGIGAVGAFVATSVHVLHVREISLRTVLSSVTPWAWFLAMSALACLGFRLGWHRVNHFFDPEMPRRPVPLARVLLVAVTLAASGVAYYVANRPNRAASARSIGPIPTGRPNIVLISLDSVRADHVSAYGYPRRTTPNLDRLASQGVLFENAVAASSWSLASLASIFTGLLPHQHGANLYLPLDTGPWTLAEILQSRGYETAGFNSNLGYSQRGWGIGRGFEVYEDDSSSLRHNLAATLVGRTLVKFLYYHLVCPDQFDRRNARQVNGEVLRWLRRRSNRPFFLFINYFDAHQSYLAPPPYDRRFGPISDALVRKVNSLGVALHPDRLSAGEREELVAGYDNCLAFVDEELAKLAGVLAGLPGGSNTIVIVTSDHGEAFGEHGTYQHGLSLHRELLHAPLIIVGPGIPPGQRVSYPVGLYGLFATVLDLTSGITSPFYQSSLRRFWNSGFQPGAFHDVVVSELIPPLPDFRPVSISLVTSEWHYIHDSNGRSELYHWPTDREERVDLSHSLQLERIRAQLDELLRDMIEQSVRPWRGAEYLDGLDRPGYSFLREIALGGSSRQKTHSELPRLGVAQSYFAPASSSLPKRPDQMTEELIKSLPYH